MGNSLSSKRKNKTLNHKKIKNNINNKGVITNSATGRHSIGIFNKTNNLKNNYDSSELFTQIKNRNQLRENLRKSIKRKSILDDNNRNSNTTANGNPYYNSDYFLDYNKIFLEIFPTNHRNTIIFDIEN